MTVYDWPRLLADVGGVSFDQRGMSVAGPVSLTGRSQTGSIDAGYWIATLSGIIVAEGSRVRLFRALRALLEGGSHQVRVPVVDAGQAPWPGSVTSVDPVHFDDATLFDDGTGFSQPVIAVSLVSAAAARDTIITVNLINSGALQGGEYFSIGDRLYVIKSIISTSGTQRTLAIWPPLREAVATGAAVEFDNPVCRMKLMSDAEMDLALGLQWESRPDVAFVEVAA